MSESDSDSEASLGDAIEAVENCLSNLSGIEQEKYIMFCPPSDTERAVLWAKYAIQEKVCTEELAELLHRLAEEPRDRPWFAWLRWLLFGLL